MNQSEMEKELRNLYQDGLDEEFMGDRPLGRGQFVVMKGKMGVERLAIKFIPYKDHGVPRDRVFQVMHAMLRCSGGSNIVKFNGWQEDVDQGHIYIGMQRYEQTLQSWIQDNSRRSADEMYRIVTGVITGIAFIHLKGLIHNDINPSNIGMIRGDPVISGFGSATLPGEPFYGTPGYICPESYKVVPGSTTKRPIADEKSDAYAFGVTIYQLYSRNFIRPTDPFGFDLSDNIITNITVQQILQRILIPRENRLTVCEISSLVVYSTSSLPRTASPTRTSSPTRTTSPYRRTPSLVQEEMPRAQPHSSLSEMEIQLRVLYQDGLDEEYMGEQKLGMGQFVVMKGRMGVERMAIKFIPFKAHDLPRDHVIKEMHALQKCSGGSNIVKFVGWQEDLEKGYICIALQRCEESLHSWIQDHTKRSTDELYRIVVGIVSGISFIHFKGFIHNDIKPHNILITRGEPVISDFFSATLPGEPFFGTDGYICPESYKVVPGSTTKRPIADEKSDAYSFGVTIYQLYSRNFMRPTDPYGFDLSRNVITNTTIKQSLQQILIPRQHRLTVREISSFFYEDL